MARRSLKQEPAEVTMSSVNAIPSQGSSKLLDKEKAEIFLQVLVVKGMSEDPACAVVGEKAILLFYLTIQVKKTKE